MGYVLWPDGPRGDIFQEVNDERNRQEDKWGEQDHDPFIYLTILMEEVGELAQAALHQRFGGPAAVKFREEAIHTAAVAVALLEAFDRHKWAFSASNWQGQA